MTAISPREAWEHLSDNILLDDITDLYCKVTKTPVDEMSARAELSERIEALTWCENTRTKDEIYKTTSEVADKYDFPYGMVLPSISNESYYNPILARGTPLSTAPYYRTEMQSILQKHGHLVRNSWERLGDRTVAILQTTNGPMGYWEPHAGNRLRKLINGMQARMDSHLSIEAELKAVDLLKTKVSESQFRCYILNGIFPERSKKSNLFYFFRKGLPIVVVSYNNKNTEGSVLCCLCVHPYGYFEFTHAGVMAPTDEVICQILMMRADEHKLWKMSGQWAAHDPRSGL